MFMHIQIQHKNTPLVCRKFLVSRLCSQDENYFFLPWLNGYVTNPNPTPTLTPNPNRNPNSNPNQINEKIRKETTLEIDQIT
jgi:hypothetical protein